MTVCKDSVTDLKILKEKAAEEIDKLRGRSIGMANYIFDNPEIGQEEFKARDYLISELKKNSFQILQGAGGLDTAFKSQYSFERPGPAVAFIAEYDALPGIGPACPHQLLAS